LHRAATPEGAGDRCAALRLAPPSRSAPVTATVLDVVHFADERCLDVACAGGKGASLARMAALGLPVPPGFAVPAGALVAALPDGGAELRALLADAEPADAAGRAQAMVTAIDPPAALCDAIAAAYGDLGDDVPVAVRSSACAEDSQAASFAGQQETYLHVRGAGDVIRRVRDCWASFFTERALFYRARKGSLEDLDMAVVVQRMVDADVAGVLFTIDPARGRRDRMVVEAVFGLGEAVVSGEVTPDQYVLARDGRVKRETLTTQPHAVVRNEAGGTRKQPLPPERGAARTLDDAQLAELAAIGRDLQDRLGVPQDIEWAIEGGRLFVLQARPVTA
jgi:pyruvate, water dikinase